MRIGRELLLCAALALPAPGRADGPGGARLHVTASPAALRLAEGARAVLRIVGAAEEPVVAASVGRIDVLREVASGVYQAEYVPPDSLDPQVAFVTVLTSGGFAWLPVPLSGVREVVVSARHGTLVSVGVGDETFGPVPADGTGRAVVRVVVPPGVHAARHGSQRIDLSVPRRRLVHVLLSQSTADANVGAAPLVRALAVTEQGAPRAGAPVALAASEGSLSAAVEVAPGTFEARWTVGPGPVGQAQVTATLRDRPPSVATAALERVPGPPRSIAIKVDREQVVAGEGDELGVTAFVLDVAGNTTEAAAILRADPGVVVEWERTARGRYDGRVQVPAQRRGLSQLEIRVVVSPALSSLRLVPLLPGPARQVRVEADGPLRADGRPHLLRISVLDRNGNRVDTAGDPVIGADRGAVDAPTRYATGAYRAEYRAPPAAEGFPDVVRARVGSLEGETRFRVAAFGGGLVLAPKVGFAVGTGGLESPTAGAEAGLWTSALGTSLGLVLEGQLYALSRRDTLQGLRLKSDVTFLALVASLGWRRPVGGWLLWLGAGGGAIQVSGRVSGIPGQADVSGRAWAATAQATVGWGRPLGPGIPFGEVKAAWQEDPGTGPVRGAVKLLAIQVGYRFDVL